MEETVTVALEEATHESGRRRGGIVDGKELDVRTIWEQVRPVLRAAGVNAASLEGDPAVLTKAASRRLEVVSAITMWSKEMIRSSVSSKTGSRDCPVLITARSTPAVMGHSLWARGLAQVAGEPDHATDRTSTRGAVRCGF